jgi:hypothetical protein
MAAQVGARGDLIRGFEDELHDTVPRAKRQWASVPAESLRYSRGPSSCGMRPSGTNKTRAGGHSGKGVASKSQARGSQP